MNQGKYIFAQLTDFLPRRVFDRIVETHMETNMSGHFVGQNGDLMLSLEGHHSKYYVFVPIVSRGNLGKANAKCSYQIFEEFANFLINEARQSCYKTEFEISVDGNVFALDSTTINLCLSVFWWAEFRWQKGGIKLYTLYDVKTFFPTFVSISNAKVYDVNILDLIPYEAGSFYFVNKAYIDYGRLY